MRALNPFMPTVPTFAVRETDVSRTANVGTWLRKRNGGQKWVKNQSMVNLRVNFTFTGKIYGFS